MILNSRDYWERRFSTEEWEEKKGREQTSFFANLIIKNIPYWFINDINKNDLSICDWGCAEGELVNLLSKVFKKSRITGIDISESAIKKAKEHYPECEFLSADIEGIGDYDIIISSNTIEHFYDPYDIALKLSNHSRKYLLFLLPFQERERIDEHFFTFEFKSIPFTIKDFNLRFFKELDVRYLHGTYWSGKQIILIYEKKFSYEQLDLSSFGVENLSNENENIQAQLNQSISERDNLWNQLNQTIAERDALSSQLNQTMAEKDSLAAQLNQVTSERDGLYGQLNNIYTSDFWKTASFYYKIRNKLFKYPHKFLQTWRREGFKRTLKKTLLKIASKNTTGVLIPVSDDDIEVRVLSASKIYAGGVSNRVSIVLPVYNQANYLKDAIEGVLSQTYKDIELIIINDGSTDGVEKVLDMYVTHPRVKIFIQENQKLPRALNNGFEHATSEFLTWTSADNIMLPNQIEELVRFLKENPDADMVFSDYQAIDDRGLPLNDSTFRPHNQYKDDHSIMRLPNIVTFENLHDSGDNFIGPSFMYRRHVAKIIGDYVHDTFGGEDYDYWLRLNSLFTIKHLNKILYKYRVHENTLNAKARELNIFENIRRLLDRDKSRREFYKRSLNISWVGFDHSNHILGPDNRTLLIFKYSLKNSPDVIERLRHPNVVSICFIDEKIDEYLADDEVLHTIDYIITASIDDFDVLYPVHRNKLFNIRDIETNLELLIKLGKVKLFERELKLSYEKKPCFVYSEDRKLNIALQVENFDKGGLEQVVYDLATHIDRKKFNVSVIVVNRNGLMGYKLKSKGIEVLEINNSIEAYLGILKNKHIDIVNSHYSYFGLDKAADLGIAVVETVHNSYTWISPETFEDIKKKSKYTDRYIFVSNQVKNYHRRRFAVPPSKAVVIPNGLNLEGLSTGASSNRYSRKALGLDEDDFIFLNVASFNSIKRHHFMIMAMKDIIKEHPDIKLLFVGNVLDVNYYNDVSGRIKTEGLEGNIRCLDFVEKPELAQIYKLADCFILPSLQEGWSIAVMEAVYFELPIIVTDIGSARDIIDGNDIGIIIGNPYEDILALSALDIAKLSLEKNADATELKEAMVNIYKNRMHWKEKTKKGKEKIINKFNIANIARNYEEQFIKAYYVARKERLNVWDLAQKGEKDFWVHVSKIGYAGYSPDEFISVLQRNSMLRALSFLEKPEEYWLDKVVVEVGSGPAGVVEFIRAKEKYAVEPLIDSYRQHYKHLSASDTKYFKQPVEKGIPLPDSFADLIICYNMLDHVLDPDRIMKECERVAKQGSYMLFQVNIYKDATFKKGEHKLLHPHTFTETSALEILEKYNFKAYKKRISEEPSDEGEYGFLIAARNTKL